MATHSSILAWRIPWREEPGGLQSIRWWRAGHAWVTHSHTHTHTHTYSFTLIPCSSDGKRLFLQCRRPRFDPWVGKILSRSKWQPTTLAWRIPWTEEPSGLQSLGLQRAGHDWATNNIGFNGSFIISYLNVFVSSYGIIKYFWITSKSHCCCCSVTSAVKNLHQDSGFVQVHGAPWSSTVQSGDWYSQKLSHSGARPSVSLTNTISVDSLSRRTEKNRVNNCLL